MIRWGRFGDIESVGDAVEQLLAEHALAPTRPQRTSEAGRFLIPIDVWQNPTIVDVVKREGYGDVEEGSRPGRRARRKGV